MSEAQLSAAIVELAELLGWRVFTVRRSDRAIVASRTGAGFPDLVMVRSGRLLAVELKRVIPACLARAGVRAVGENSVARVSRSYESRGLRDSTVRRRAAEKTTQLPSMG